MNGSKAKQLVVVVVVADARGNENLTRLVTFVISTVLRHTMNGTAVSGMAIATFKYDTKTAVSAHQSTRQSTSPGPQAYHTLASRAIFQMS